ncbi:MAG TPA: hypothetical protein VIH42_02100 [Thermoguttaceae bacterium]
MLHLHQYDERDLPQAEISPICRILLVYSCCEDDFHKIYIFDESEQEYAGEIIKEAA